MGFKTSTIGYCCHDCTERFPACHDVCAEYLKAKAEWQEHKEQIKESRKLDRFWDSYHHDRVASMKRQMASKERNGRKLK